MTEHEPAPESSTSSNLRNNVGCWIGWAGLLLGFSPILVALTAPIVCGPDANEGNCGVAAAPWFMFFSLPMGLIMGVAGIIVYAINKRQAK